MRLLDFFRSIKAGMRASRTLGRGFGMRDRGDMRGAMAQAQIGLAILGQSFVRRNQPVEGSCLIGLTILAEETALELGGEGASIQDLADSIDNLKESSGDAEKGLNSYLPFLEERLALRTVSAESRGPAA
jgi:hypothetical protein